MTEQWPPPNQQGQPPYPQEQPPYQGQPYPPGQPYPQGQPYAPGQPYQPYPQGPAPYGYPGTSLDPEKAPRELKPVLVLLMVNLGLSILLTIVTVLARHSIVTYQLDHRNITDPDLRRTLRDSYSYGIIGRVVGNIVVSVVYVFLVRALLRGRRWAYRRVILLGIIGVIGLLVIQGTPYPPWMRAEQLVQAVVLALLVFFVTRPAVRAHFASGLPGRDVRRFRR